MSMDDTQQLTTARKHTMLTKNTKQTNRSTMERKTDFTTPKSSGKSELGLQQDDSGYGSPIANTYWNDRRSRCYDRPCKAGREQMDIVSSLKDHEPALVEKILSHLDAKDLVSFSGVNREWREICRSNRATESKKRQLLNQKRKWRKDFKENYRKQCIPRFTVSSATALGEIQALGKPCASSTPAPKAATHHEQFIQASTALFVDESLTRCARADCSSPAKLLMNKQRALCQRCGYDFCTNCHLAFHGGSDCNAFRAKNAARAPHGVNSSRSRSSLRRLARLESYP